MRLPAPSQPFMKALEAMLKAADTRSCLALAEGCRYAHDSIYRALSLALEVFFTGCLALCKRLGGLTHGCLVLDDVVISRWQQGRLGLSKLKDPATGQYVYGFGVVLLMWCNGRIRLPLAFRLYFGNGLSKGQLALALLHRAAAAGLRPECVLLDAWYACKTLLNEIHGLGWSFVTRLRKNRVLDGRQLRYHGSPFWVKEGKLRGVGFRVKVVRRGRYYLCTNALSFSREQIVAYYKLRGNIEEVFRGLQQELGWQGQRQHKRETLAAYLALGLLSYALIEYHRNQPGCMLTFYQYRRKLISGSITPDLSPLLEVAA